MSVSRLNVELHCHTVFSKDGFITFDSLAHAAARIGLDAVAITDHDTIEGAKEFQRRAHATDVGLKIIVGEEKTLADGSHVIGLFLQEHIQSGDLVEAMGEIQAQGGLCLIPHPFRKRDGLLRDGLQRLPLFQNVNASFEIFNAKCCFADNQQARELLTTCLLPFGGSDAHYESDLGECVNVLPWEDDLKTSIQRMLQGKTSFHILGRRQTEQDAERSYAPLYYRWKKYVRIPKPLLPAAKQCYRWYRNKRFGIGRKPLDEVYAHA